MELSRNVFYKVILLTVTWIVLTENFSIPSIAAGIVVSACSILFSYRYLPFPKITSVRLLRLAFYPFYLAGKVYLSAFNTMRLIITGANVDIVEEKTQLSSEFLRTLLANSITLTPGTISLELENNTLTVLLLKEKVSGSRESKSAAAVKDKLEKMLLKAQRRV